MIKIKCSCGARSWHLSNCDSLKGEAAAKSEQLQAELKLSASAINKQINVNQGLRAKLERLGSNEAFDVATADISDELKMRIDFARAALREGATVPDARILAAAMWFIMRYRPRQDWGNQISEAWEHSGYLIEDLNEHAKKHQKEKPF